MRPRSRRGLSDSSLMRQFDERLANERLGLAELLADIGEIDRRRLYAAAGYSSMHDYCVHAKHMSDDEAYRRVRVALKARRFPAILDEIAAGRPHLTGALKLARYMTEATAADLLAAAAHKTKQQILEMLAERFPQADVPTRMYALTPIEPTSPLAQPTQSAQQVAPADLVPEPNSFAQAQLAPEPAESLESPPALEPVPPTQAAQPAPRPIPAEMLRDQVKPLSQERVLLQTTIDRETQDLLGHVQALLSHQAPAAELGDVLKRALRALARELEKKKFAATDEPRSGVSRDRATRMNSNVASRSYANVREGQRYIPASVKRRVMERDGGRCAFVSDDGRRCECRSFLEFDHIIPVALGGRSTTANVRMLCQGHNQFEADRTFGAEFMRQKRETVRTSAAGGT